MQLRSYVAPFACALLAFAVDSACSSDLVVGAPGEASGTTKKCSSDGTKTGTCSTGDDDDSTSAKTSTLDAGDAGASDPAIVQLAGDISHSCATVDDDAIFWVRTDGSVAGVFTTDVPSVGAPTPTTAPTLLRATAAATSGTCGIYRDGEYLWVTAWDLGALLRFKVSKTVDDTILFDPDVLTIPGFVTPSSVVVDASYVYVVEHDSGAIRRIVKPGPDADAGVDAGAPFLLSPGAAGDASHLYTDGQSLFWSTVAMGSPHMRKMAIAGGPIDELTSEIGELHPIGASLYFQCGASICTVPAGGGLTTKVALTDPYDRDAGSGPQVLAFTSAGNNLYYADGALMHVAGDSNEVLFRYSAGVRSITLYAQRNRLVWFSDQGLFTRSVF